MSSTIDAVFQEHASFDPEVSSALPPPAKAIPPAVWDNMKRTYVGDNANITRGLHKLTGLHLRLRAIIPLASLRSIRRRLSSLSLSCIPSVVSTLRVMFLALKVFMEFCGDKDVDLAVPAEVSCHLAWSGAAVNTPVVPLPAGADPFDISSAYRATKKMGVRAISKGL
ncbi:hypothetical protein CC1G_13041 [Coprinopsis cinerea okayama7|uniref:Uncharacterized protein n=1 Tax=Coprinopsis cinerea (strain Okayama-7 / 130 / ATCC MYA-4618 / FGSC 9003) TaxID=240176 RepID=A8N6R0_COPC7|nr:hypothetical protein CC1G_13041 [Coprinopsis cinerea okayama7\|eukprot:XP_001830516.2 hypothetical protein CC1G_13041 [Coprinopsis cinerea okayama7\